MGILQSYPVEREGSRASTVSANILARSLGTLVWADLVRSRVQVGLYVLFVVFVSVMLMFQRASAAPAPTGSAPSELLVMIGLAVAAILTLSAIVQADSPTDTSAYWRRAPISGSTMLVAKSLSVVLAVGVPAVTAQVLVLAQFTSSPVEILGITTHAFTSVLAFLLTMAILAAVTPNAASFITFSIVYAVAIQVVGFVVLPNIEPANEFSLKLLTALVQLAWLAWIYTSLRQSVIRLRLQSAVIILGAVLGPSGVAAAMKRMRGDRVPPQFLVTTFSARVDSGNVILSFDVPAPGIADQVSISNMSAAIVAEDGGRTPLVATVYRSSGTSVVNGVTTRLEGVSLTAGTDGLTIDSSVSPAIGHVKLFLGPERSSQLLRLQRSNMSLEFSGTFVTQRLDTVLKLPLALGNVNFQDGLSMRSTIIPNSTRDSAFQVQLWLYGGPSVGTSGRAGTEATGKPRSGRDLVHEFALIDDKARASSYALVADGKPTIEVSPNETFTSSMPMPIPASFFQYRMYKFGRTGSVDPGSGQREAGLRSSDITGRRLVGMAWHVEREQQLRARLDVR